MSCSQTKGQNYETRTQIIDLHARWKKMFKWFDWPCLVWLTNEKLTQLRYFISGMCRTENFPAGQGESENPRGMTGHKSA